MSLTPRIRHFSSHHLTTLAPPPGRRLESDSREDVANFQNEFTMTYALFFANYYVVIIRYDVEHTAEDEVLKQIDRSDVTRKMHGIFNQTV